ncbi:hypothetical protein QYE76_039533 [Lolium multiflorum]|uniref:Transposase (putative) gypsy type domain-containing protein n=1 Tax=Lolium multiflorum TaxID=4521 RepID=A0AAD8TA24_LOLMU|nr:hypothetical protein QYE76_039533 [Lolium multiflorum]
MATEDLKLSEWERSKISNQDVNLLKKLGLMKKEKMLIFPSEESFPSPGIGYRLHYLTPKSILHISIFITLCECFLGTPPNWGLWKRIFLVRRNSSHNTAYNVGGVFICIRPDVEYFDVKFPDSVQGWRKRWLYIREEDVDSQEYNVAPFDGSEKILRRRSWDAEATDEEKTATEALMKRIHDLQNTRGKELSAHSIPSTVSPRNKRKRGDAEGSGTSKLSSSPAKEPAPEGTSPEEEETFNAYDDALVSSGDEEEEPAVNVTAPMSTSQTLALSETHRTAEETSPPQHDLQMSTPAASPRASSPKRARIELGKEYNVAGSSVAPPLDDPLMQHFISLGTQFIGYRDTVNGLKEALAKANKRADDLSIKLEQSDQARKKAEQDAASIGDLRKRLHEAETALSDKITQQIAQEEDVIGRLESQNRIFARKMGQDFELEEPEGNRLRDALSLLEIHGDLARRTIVDVKTAFTRLFPYFFPKKDQPSTFAALTKCFIPEEDLGLALRQENFKIGVEGTIALVAESQQTVDWAKAGSFLDATAEDQRVDARFQDRASQVRQYLEFCTKTLAMVYNVMFPRNIQPKTLPELMKKFKNPQQIHGFVKAQLIAGARFALIMLQICHSKLEMTKVVETVHAKLKKRWRFVDKINDRVTPVAEEMIDDLLRMDADFFMEGHYADFMGASADEDRVNIDVLIGHD